MKTKLIILAILLTGLNAMAQKQTISQTAPVDNIKQAFAKVNHNFTELYDDLADTTDLYTAISTLTVVKLPSLTTTQINNIASPVNGMIVFNSTTGDLWMYSGAWYKLSKATP